MDNSFDTSFIPQQPLLKVEGSVRRGEAVDVSLVLAFVIFFVTLVVWGGMYFYKTSIDRRILASEKELDKKEASFKIEEIDRYKAIDERLKIARGLLNGHTAFSTVFTLLEKITAKNVGWTALSYGIDSSNGLIKISLTGQAPSYSAAYAQAEAWRSKSMSETLKKVEVGTPGLDSISGIVTFGAALTIDPNSIKYARLLKKEEAAGSVTPNKTATSISTGAIVATSTSPKAP